MKSEITSLKKYSKKKGFKFNEQIHQLKEKNQEQILKGKFEIQKKDSQINILSQHIKQLQQNVMDLNQNKNQELDQNTLNILSNTENNNFLYKK